MSTKSVRAYLKTKRKKCPIRGRLKGTRVKINVLDIKSNVAKLKKQKLTLGGKLGCINSFQIFESYWIIKRCKDQGKGQKLNLVISSCCLVM